MGRALLQILVPLALPLALYFAWATVTRRVAQARGLPPSGPVPSLVNGPWALLLGAGLVLVILGFVVWAVTQETLPAGQYVPSRLIDGKVVPGYSVGSE